LLRFNNTYIGLGKPFFQRSLPQKVPAPDLLLFNSALANSLGLPDELQNDNVLLSQYFSGNQLLEGTEPIALAYSGHQFGHFNPQLGDGRAHLLGEVLDNNNIRRDIQLKGSGQTAFSRRGDGKCALAPALREYIMSEALYALGVPTSRCLAIVSTGEVINRGLTKAAAVVTRVAASHIRVGTFQYFAARGDIDSLKALLNYTINRHFPDINQHSVEKHLKIHTPEQERILAFLTAAMDKQITLVIQWLRIGFIHGVMNTDNTAICGETLDFGPCAMLGNYDENAVFSSIDEYSRYAFGNQGKIAQWNMARLADSLLPLLTSMSDNKSAKNEQALTQVETVIHQFSDKFDSAYFSMYSNKIGLTEVNSTIKSLINELLAIMQTERLDYTQTFHALTLSLTDNVIVTELKEKLGDWINEWLAVLEKSALNIEQAQQLMKENNPIVIPRNHHVEALLTQCEDSIATKDKTSILSTGKAGQLVNEFLTVLRSPYDEIDATKKYQDAPKDNDQYYQTFCGT